MKTKIPMRSEISTAKAAKYLESKRKPSKKKVITYSELAKQPVKKRKFKSIKAQVAKFQPFVK